MAGTTILLVEDNSGDVHLIEGAFGDRALPGDLHVVKTGEAALDWLYQRDAFAEAPRPDLVLLDLNLPVISGQEVLEAVKSDPDLKRIPVVVLTGTQAESDLREAYDARANACLIKPVDPDDFGDLIELVTEFWVDVVAFPPATGAADER